MYSIFKYIPEVREDFLPFIVEHCLTMRSGIDYYNNGKREKKLLAQISDSHTGYILQYPMKSIPGTEKVYKNSDHQLLVKLIIT